MFDVRVRLAQGVVLLFVLVILVSLVSCLHTEPYDPYPSYAAWCLQHGGHPMPSTTRPDSPQCLGNDRLPIPALTEVSPHADPWELEPAEPPDREFPK